MKIKISKICIVLLILVLYSCNKEDDVVLPVYSSITLTPDKAIYNVGDTVVCSITQNKAGGENLLETTYWWYASWWFTDTEMTADFQEFDENSICSSSKVVLTESGEVTLYFFGQLKYPKWNWMKIEIPLKIKVEE